MKMVFRTRVSRLSAGLIAAATLALATAPPAQGVERSPTRVAALAPVGADSGAQTEARVIVKFKAESNLMRIQAALPSGADGVGAASGAAGAGPQQAQALSRRLGVVLRDGRSLGARSQLVLAKGIGSADLAARLAAQSDVEYAVVDGRMRSLSVPNDPLYAAGQATTPAVGQWYLRAPDSAAIASASTVVASINAEAAWAITSGKASVVVAVLDTGVRPEHPDLAGKLLPGYDFISNAGTANDGDGRDADPTDPGDGVTTADLGVVNGCKTSADISNSSWHGTQTAGLIGAATNNNLGMAGAGRDVMVLPVRVLGKCGGFDSDIQDALKWAAGIAVSGVPANPNPAKVINLSLGSAATCSQAYADVFQQVAARGVVVVASAGNDGLSVGSPANCANVIAVGGVRHAGTKVGYSDLGAQIDISAPAGNCVNDTGTCLYPLLTTGNSGALTAGTSIYTDGDTHLTVGTSFASPLVAGTVALMFSVNSTLTPAQTLAALQASARTFPSSGAPPVQLVTGGPMVAVAACNAPTSTAQNSECYCSTSTCGAGLLDAGAAVALVAKVTANITVVSSAVVAGVPVSLNGSSSRSADNLSIASYLWTVTSGSAIGKLSSATNASTATLATTGAGAVTVSLTVTDSAGKTDTASTSLTVSAAVTPVTPVTPGQPGLPTPSGGGGALSAGWLLGCLAAVFGVFAVKPRRVAGRSTRR